MLSSIDRKLRVAFTPPHLAQVVVKICVPSAEVAPQQSGVRGEDCGHGEAAGAAQDQPGSCLPLVEMANHVGPLPQLVGQLR